MRALQAYSYSHVCSVGQLPMQKHNRAICEGDLDRAGFTGKPKPRTKISPSGHLHFGKHKGKHLKAVPTGYLRWIVGKKGFAKTEKKLVRTELKRRNKKGGRRG